MAFQKAVKARSKLRAALFGPSGAGKTFTALAMGQGMGGTMALIDSERGSASKYADRFDFDTVDLETKKVEEYISLINEAKAQGYAVLIIDSLTHAWQTLNEEVEKIADARYKGNFWAAWSEGTPLQRKLIDALVSYPGHIIATMRSKTEWQTGEGNGNKSRPVRVGLAPEQGKGIEYEFDILFELTPEHLATIIKDRTGKFQDRIIEKPGKAFGQELVDWLNEGAAPPPPSKTREELQDEYISAKNELKHIMGTQIGDRYLFTEEEYKAVSDAFANLKGKSAKECVAVANALLAEKKSQLKDRIGPHQETEELPTTSQNSKPTAPEQAEDQKPVKHGKEPAAAQNVGESQKGTFAAEFQNHLANKNSTKAAEPAVPTMYSEPEQDDFFEDDIPEEENHEFATAEAEAELDIF